MPGQNGARSNILEFQHVGNIPAIFSSIRRMNIKHVYKINVWSKFQVLLSKFHFAAQFRVRALRRSHGAIAQKRIAAGQSNSNRGNELPPANQIQIVEAKNPLELNGGCQRSSSKSAAETKCFFRQWRRSSWELTVVNW